MESNNDSLKCIRPLKRTTIEFLTPKNDLATIRQEAAAIDFTLINTSSSLRAIAIMLDSYGVNEIDIDRDYFVGIANIIASLAEDLSEIKSLFESVRRFIPDDEPADAEAKTQEKLEHEAEGGRLAKKLLWETSEGTAFLKHFEKAKDDNG